MEVLGAEGEEGMENREKTNVEMDNHIIEE